MTRIEELEKENAELKEICAQLIDRVKFAIDRLHSRGLGMVISTKTHKIQKWRHYMAEGISLAGYDIDPNDLDALDLPAKEKRKYFENKMKEKAHESK